MASATISRSTAAASRAVADASPSLSSSSQSTGDQLLELGWEIAAHQYRAVHLAARFDDELEWFRRGCKSASHWIAQRLQIQSSTAREWIRVGHALRYLPQIDAAFAAQHVSYAKVRILTRWADADNEERLLALAIERSASRLTVALAAALAEDGETEKERDRRLHDDRSFTTWTDGDGMTVIRVVLPPSAAKPVVAAVDELVRRIAEMPSDEVTEDAADASADAFSEPCVAERSPGVAEASLATTIGEARRRWQPAGDGGWMIPTLAQQRADAFLVLFLGLDVAVTTEIVVHVRSDGTTFDDGTPTTDHALLRQFDRAFIRLLIHDADRRPINASGRRRHPTTRQKRVVMEAHGHECVDCQSVDLLEIDHSPPHEESRRTITGELEPRCAPCHRARHRFDEQPGRQRAA